MLSRANGCYLLLITVATAHADGSFAHGPAELCANGYARIGRELIAIPNHIPKNDVKPESFELAEAGHVLRPGEKLPNFGGEPPRDGRYLYLIDKRNNVIYSPRIPENTTAEKFLATHRALYNRLKLENEYHSEHQLPEIVAAGEFVIFNGHVKFFSSKAGTFFGANEHFEYARKVLANRNLRFEPTTRYLDVATVLENAQKKFEIDRVAAESKGSEALRQFLAKNHRPRLDASHLSDAKDAKIEMEFLRDPRYREAIRGLQEVYRRLQKISSQASCAGCVNLPELVNFIPNLNERTDIGQIFSRLNDEGYFGGIYLIEKQGSGRDSVFNVLEKIEHLYQRMQPGDRSFRPVSGSPRNQFPNEEIIERRFVAEYATHPDFAKTYSAVETLSWDLHGQEAHQRPLNDRKRELEAYLKGRGLVGDELDERISRGNELLGKLYSGQSDRALAHLRLQGNLFFEIQESAADIRGMLTAAGVPEGPPHQRPELSMNYAAKTPKVEVIPIVEAPKPPEELHSHTENIIVPTPLYTSSIMPPNLTAHFKIETNERLISHFEQALYKLCQRFPAGRTGKVDVQAVLRALPEPALHSQVASFLGQVNTNGLPKALYEFQRTDYLKSKVDQALSGLSLAATR